MADDLDDGEFWLPSQFLTDYDILVDFSPKNRDAALGFGSDLDLPSNGSVTGSTETESDEDELLAGLTRQMTRSSICTDCTVDSQGWVLSSSPQSTLCCCIGKEGSCRDSPNGPVSPPPAADNDGGATWDLLYKAVGEVARIKMRNKKTASVGTGFFDCSSKGLLCSTPRTTPPITATTSSYSQPQFPPLSHLKELRQQQMMKPQFSLKRSNINSNKNSIRPLGLPPSAWPPLQGQAKNQPIRVVPPMFLGQPGPKRESVGTGVFLPRSVTSPRETLKKPGINVRL